MTAIYQVHEMQSLHQAAAAWLLGCSSRELRDRADIPRDADGRYSAKDILLAAARSRKAFCRHDAQLLAELSRS